MAKAASDAEIAMNSEDQQAVVGAAALGDRHDRQPRRRRSAPACGRRPDACDHRRQRVDDEAGQDAGEEAERGEDEHRGEREAVDLAARSAAAGARGRPRKVTPKALTKQAAASAADSASSAPTAGHQELQAPLRQLAG